VIAAKERQFLRQKRIKFYFPLQTINSSPVVIVILLSPSLFYGWSIEQQFPVSGRRFLKKKKTSFRNTRWNTWQKIASPAFRSHNPESRYLSWRIPPIVWESMKVNVKWRKSWSHRKKEKPEELLWSKVITGNIRKAESRIRFLFHLSMKQNEGSCWGEDILQRESLSLLLQKWS
jgi:hypothetical protein